MLKEEVFARIPDAYCKSIFDKSSDYEIADNITELLAICNKENYKQIINDYFDALYQIRKEDLKNITLYEYLCFNCRSYVRLALTSDKLKHESHFNNDIIKYIYSKTRTFAEKEIEIQFNLL